MQLNTLILRELSYQITQGNPWWGMLLVNEYLDGTNYLRRALVHRFMTRITPAQRDHSLAQSLISGSTARELPEELRDQIGSRFVRTARHTDFAEDRHGRRRRIFGARRSGSLRRRSIAPQFAPREASATARRSE